MPPQPFPYHLSIGTDVCRVSRIVKILHNERRTNLWAQKVFTRLEWPVLWRAFLRAQIATTRSSGKGSRDLDFGEEFEAIYRKKWSQLKHSAPDDKNIWLLPKISEQSIRPSQGESSDSSPEMTLARFLAGR